VADAGDAGGIPRIDFREPDAHLEQIDRETFFAVFEERKLALLYQDETAGGKTSRFNKFVAQE
jgi:hypothetical protein